MVAGMLLHFASLRKMKTGYGADIRELLAEAENERMHLMFFIEIAKPNWFERWLVLIAQFTFSVFYSVLYLVDSRTAHRMVAYFEEEAVYSYTEYLDLVERGVMENVPAPQLAIDYYGMSANAKLVDLIKTCARRRTAAQRESTIAMRTAARRLRSLKRAKQQSGL